MLWTGKFDPKARPIVSVQFFFEERHVNFVSSKGATA